MQKLIINAKKKQKENIYTKFITHAKNIDYFINNYSLCFTFETCIVIIEKEIIKNIPFCKEIYSKYNSNIFIVLHNNIKLIQYDYTLRPKFSVVIEKLQGLPHNATNATFTFIFKTTFEDFICKKYAGRLLILFQMYTREKNIVLLLF